VVVQVGFGTTCVTGYSEVLHSADFASFDEFWSQLQATWDDMWVRVYSADAKSELRVLMHQASSEEWVCSVGEIVSGVMRGGVRGENDGKRALK
jgi:hypothetical protein